MINVSIIIPHRGPKEMLDKCLASIPQREDVKVIVVEDEEGRGAGWARNIGLETAEGEYVIFADSDDFFHPCFNNFLDYLKQVKDDMVFFNADSIDLLTGQPSWRANHLNRIFRNNDSEWQERHLRYYFTEPWCRAIRLSLITRHNIRFSESLKLNDIFFTSQVGYYAGQISVYNEKCYCIGNQDQSTAKLKDETRALHVARESARANKFLQERGIEHIHSRMMRPLVAALLKGNLRLACGCWREMRSMGLSRSFLLYCFLRYPRDLVKLLIRKRQSGEI